MPRRSLSLKKEVLAELTPDELKQVVGADAGITTPAKVCVSELISCAHYCLSWDTEQC